ncbi:MAG: gliding motility-associated C-terminal domain-containing protein [Lewinellaceae bacterium]|nr:gliding motility-associated C-terminal domain-containing protein [Lewinellaceae bacterium]
MLCLFSRIFATHNRSGEITYVQLDALTIKITVTTYTKTSSTSADRDSLLVSWGDGSTQFVHRVSAIPLPNDIKVNKYEAVHTYPGKATYTVSFADPNRIASILNVNWPNSVEVPFFLETTFTLLDSQFQGLNNSAILLQPPIDFACLGHRFVHNPNAYDLDGDSLAYELTIPLMAENEEVPDYKFPDKIFPGGNNKISLNPITGEFVWDSPQEQGEYNIAILIKEYRKGVLINTIIRDMQILVLPCDNSPPKIETEKEICVIAGSLIQIPVNVDDPNSGQKVGLFASGGPFALNDSPAILSNAGQFQNPAYQSEFSWQTTCNHISDQYYQVVFRAVDNYLNDTFGLATLKTLRIKVVGPAPQNLTAESKDDHIILNWDLPYACEITENEYFRGFSVWRKENSQAIDSSECASGLDGYGYKKIKFSTKENDGTHYFYEDYNVEPRVEYCYRVLAEFAKTSSTGQPFNKVESKASNEFCILLKQDFPMITEVSVATTDYANGQIDISYIKPFPDDLDTLEHPAPYLYEVWRKAQNETDFNLVPGANQFSSEFGSYDESFNYSDIGLNTKELQYEYEIRFYSNNLTQEYSKSKPASSIYLTAIPSDQKIMLEWNEITPWNNYNYEIYRQDSGIFSLLGESEKNNFVDENLENGKEYCYYVKSAGSYNLNRLPAPLYNDSQITCASPSDNVAPCSPILSLMNLCEKDESSPIDTTSIYNFLKWDLDCAETMVSYKLYFAKDSSNFSLLATDINIKEYIHYPQDGSLSGCYYVTAIDSIGNESASSDIVCAFNCPLYELPNTFTPNGDGFNDLFVPRLNRFIAKVDFKVYNQWGNLVFETTDPNLNWNGHDLKGNKLPDDVYYYTCRVYYDTIEGIENSEDLLRGHINMIE